jgi:hypothetical protein
MKSVLELEPVDVLVFLPSLDIDCFRVYESFVDGKFRNLDSFKNPPAIDSDGAHKVLGLQEKSCTHKDPPYHGNNCTFIEGKDSPVDLPCFSFHSFRLLLFFIENLENPETA